MKSTTRDIASTAEYRRIEKDQFGNTKVGFEVSGIINCKEVRLTYNVLTETGGLALGENVKLSSNVQLAKQCKSACNDLGRDYYKEGESQNDISDDVFQHHAGFFPSAKNLAGKQRHGKRGMTSDRPISPSDQESWVNT